MAKKKKMREKHVPMRMCIVTRERKPKLGLMRLVNVNGKVKVDPKGKERGRGANICMEEDVFDEAVRKHLIEKALKLEKKLTEEEVKKLRKEFLDAIERRKFRKGSKPVVIKVDKEKWRKIIKKE